jgi:hypothetical protein
LIHWKSKGKIFFLQNLAPFSALSGKFRLYFGHDLFGRSLLTFFTRPLLSYAAEHSAVGNTVSDALRGIRA